MTNVIVLEPRTLGSRCCSDAAPVLSTSEAETVSADLQMLGHPVRLQILTMLGQREGQVCVCDLEAALPVKQPTVSHHLRLLREAGLIDCERHGQWAYYFLKHDAMQALQARVSSVMSMVR